MGLLENADYVALDVAIAVHVRGLQTGPILVENQPFRIRQIIGLPNLMTQHAQIADRKHCRPHAPRLCGDEKRFVRFEAYIAPHLVGLAAKVRGMSRRLF
jgi:hypothetical protein